MAKKGQPWVPRLVPDCGRDCPPSEPGGGYRSPRISYRGTLEMRSHDNTRSAGTPDLRHLYKDCGLMPSASQSGMYPPAPLMMRSSTSGDLDSGAASSVSGVSIVPPTLQPKAGKWQQPEAALRVDTIPPVNNPAKAAVLLQFGARLTAVLNALNWPVKKRPKELSELLKRHGITVHPETARSWIAGEKAPAGANGQMLCKALRANHAYLFHGDGEMFAADPLDDQLAEIQREWVSLRPAGREFMVKALAMAKNSQLAEDAGLPAQQSSPVKEQASSPEQRRARHPLRQRKA